MSEPWELLALMLPLLPSRPIGGLVGDRTMSPVDIRETIPPAPPDDASACDPGLEDLDAPPGVAEAELSVTP